MITPWAPPSGTTTSAVTACDLFLTLRTLLSLQTAHAAEEDLRVSSNEHRPADEVGIEPLDAPVVERERAGFLASSSQSA